MFPESRPDRVTGELVREWMGERVPELLPTALESFSTAGRVVPGDRGTGQPLGESGLHQQPLGASFPKKSLIQNTFLRENLRTHNGEGHGNHSSILAWRIPGTGEPGGLSSMGSTESDMTEAT